jgi:hypothetical protein
MNPVDILRSVLPPDYELQETLVDCMIYKDELYHCNPTRSLSITQATEVIKQRFKRVLWLAKGYLDTLYDKSEKDILVIFFKLFLQSRIQVYKIDKRLEELEQ